MNNKHIFLVSALFLSSCSSHLLSKKNPNSVSMQNKYTTVKKEGVVLNVDLGTKSDIDSVLYFDSTCVITGSNHKINMVVAGPKFEPKNLPEILYRQFYSVKAVNFSRGNTFKTDTVKDNLPIWLTEMNHLTYLRLEDVKINKLNFLQNTSVEQLILVRVEFENQDNVVNALSGIERLKYFVIKDTNILPKNIFLIKNKFPGIKILSEDAYYKAINSGAIFPQY